MRPFSRFTLGVVWALGFLLGPSSNASPTAGFESGNTFSIRPLSGWVTLDCPQVISQRHCSGEYYDPKGMDYFVIAEVVDADRFRLIAPQPDGSSIQKSGIFKAEQRRSWLPVNLLPRTLTQVPLLRVGHQTIQYILTKDGRSVEEGYFQVRVFKENPKTCPSKSMTPVLPGECEDASNAVCDRFFQECLSTF